MSTTRRVRLSDHIRQDISEGRKGPDGGSPRRGDISVVIDVADNSEHIVPILTLPRPLTPRVGEEVLAPRVAEGSQPVPIAARLGDSPRAARCGRVTPIFTVVAPRPTVLVIQKAGDISVQERAELEEQKLLILRKEIEIHCIR